LELSKISIKFVNINQLNKINYGTEEIKNIEENLGDKIKVIEEFFENNNGYNDKMLAEAGITTEELREYADLGLGKEIRDCIKENGSCSFEAEC